MKKRPLIQALVLTAALFAGLGSAQAGFLSLGVQYDGWATTNTLLPINGAEFSVPFSTNFKLDDSLGFFAQANFIAANYTGETSGSLAYTYNPANFSDSVIGTDIHFNSFGVSSLVDFSLNLPSGNQDWETEQVGANIPTEFIDSRYRGRGFGFNAMYALAIPSGGNEQFGVAAGYLFSGAYNTLSIPDLALGDSLFVALDRIEAFGNNKSSAIRLTALYFLPTSLNGSNELQEGPNVDASYSYEDPKGFSYEIGAQFFTPSRRSIPVGAPLVMEPHNSLGQRFYVAPSLALGQLTIGGLVKYILPNDYSQSDVADYNGGGLVLGLTPTLTAPLDSVSDLKFSAGYDYIVAHNAGSIGGGALGDIFYNYWQVGTNYEIKL